jgi:hypothetical protein
LENLNGVMETGIVPMYGTDREVNLRYFLIWKIFINTDLFYKVVWGKQQQNKLYCAEFVARCVWPAGPTVLGSGWVGPVRWPGTGHFHLGLRLDPVFHDLDCYWGAVDTAPSPMPHQLMPHPLVSIYYLKQSQRKN